MPNRILSNPIFMVNFVNPVKELRLNPDKGWNPSHLVHLANQFVIPFSDFLMAFLVGVIVNGFDVITDFMTGKFHMNILLAGLPGI